MSETNARHEFLRLTDSAGGYKNLICATITSGKSYDEEQKTALLPKFFTDDQFESFLQAIDIDYDSGYGSQEIFGIVWFENGVWAERDEYDGSEWWKLNSYPEIPQELI